MGKILRSPLARISFGLTMLTVTLVLASDLLGLIPDTRTAALEARKTTAESLAVMLTSAIAEGQTARVQDTLGSVVERNPRIRSGAVRDRHGKVLAVAGKHADNWTLKPDEHSTATEIQVPLYDEKGRWGSVELRFTPLTEISGLLSFQQSLLSVALFVAVAGFLVYLIFLKRTLRELNPDAVIPERVRSALDTLAEGLLIIDERGYIVFANSAFARRTGQLPEALTGKSADTLDWRIQSEDDSIAQLPWLRVLDGEELASGTTIRLKTTLGETYTFAVNAAPINASDGQLRGVLITFDDITEIERKNDELQRTLRRLEQSQRAVTRQNQELQVLATRDPLTNALNRRSLFQGLETLFNEARRENEPLSFIMVDIDHFKSVNDRFGHGVGDKVIQYLAGVLTEYSRPNDLVGRFGGEEFCVVLPATGIDTARDIAETMRKAIQENRGAEFADLLRITSSFGVAMLDADTRDHNILVEQADQALYVAKESGRNRVVCHQVDGNAVDASPAAATDNIIPLPSNDTPDDQPAAQDSDVGAKLLTLPTSGTPCSPPNRVVLFDRIEQAIKRSHRYDTQIAVLMLEPDNLQTVRDTFGLAVADKLAAKVISRLKTIFRDTDTVTLTQSDELLFSIAQLENDQIVILLTELADTEVITSLLQRVFTTLDEPVDIDGNELRVTTHVGACIYPFDGNDPETLVRNASIALHESRKTAAGPPFLFYSEDINRRAKQQIRLEAELKHALDNEEFLIYYQPKVDLNSGVIRGLEALLRWRHPQLGIVSPNDFIPLAEKTGLISEMTRWVMHGVCQQLAEWRRIGHEQLSVAINLSPITFRDRNLGRNLLAELAEHDIPPAMLEAEITETVVMQNMDTAIDILTELHDAGVSIALDDFGTGYSSMHYLKRFPLSKVKIDRSFITDFIHASNDAAIVSAIIAMAHSLGLNVVAEGVETEEQLHFLQDLHCDEMQGYLFSRPVPREEATRLLAQSSGIQRMIREYGLDFARLGNLPGSRPASGMIGILNEFPAAAR